MRQYLERKAHINLYYSLFFAYLIYCNEVWGNASAVHPEPIIKIQKRAIRTITFSSYLSPSDPIFQSIFKYSYFQKTGNTKSQSLDV